MKQRPDVASPSAANSSHPSRDDQQPQLHSHSPLTPLRHPATWLLLLVLGLEFFVFDAFGSRRYTAIHPRWNDQVQYLRESYTAFEHARAHGFFSGLWQTLTTHSAQGTVHDFFAVIAFKFAGASRSTALALNFLALAAWQFALYLAVLRRAQRPALAFAAALLPAMLLGPWQDIPGSAYDFRLDHLALCALGVTAAMAWLSHGFLSRSGSLLFGGAVALTVLTRFLTGTYFVLLFAGAAVWALIGSERRTRFTNLSLAALLAVVLAGPVLWSAFGAIRDYYWIGHYVGPESTIRDPGLSVIGSLSFISHHVFHRHLGAFIVIVAAAGTLALAALRKSPAARAGSDGWMVSTLFFLAPAIILTLHRQKSEVAVGALIPGLVTFFAAAWVSAAQRASLMQLRVFAFVAALVGLAFFGRAQVHPPVSADTLTNTRLVNSLADEVVRRSRSAGLPVIRVAVDHITDALDAPILQIVCYERRGAWLEFDKTLPRAIEAPSETEVFARLGESDFVVVTVDAPPGPYPFDRRLAELRPKIRAWCDEHLRVANDFTLSGRRMLLYQRRELPFP